MQDLLVFRWHQEDLYEFQGSPKRGSSRGFQWPSYEDLGELNRAFRCISVALKERVSREFLRSGDFQGVCGSSKDFQGIY